MDMEKLSLIIDKMLDLLNGWEFIQYQKDDFMDADKIDNSNVKSTLLGKRVAELYIDPLTAYFFTACFRNASDKQTK